MLGEAPRSFLSSAISWTNGGPRNSSVRPTWSLEYAKEQGATPDAAGGCVRVIEHIGSTAVVGLAAKPIIDIAVGVDSVDAVQSHVVRTLEPLGYKLFDAGMPGRLFLFRAEPEQHTHHLHVLPLASWDDLKERLFRDWLRDHPVDRDRYAALKRALAEARRTCRAIRAQRPPSSRSLSTQHARHAVFRRCRSGRSRACISSTKQRRLSCHLSGAGQNLSHASLRAARCGSR